MFCQDIFATNIIGVGRNWKFDGVVESSIYCVATAFQTLGILLVLPCPWKTTAPCTPRALPMGRIWNFLLSHQCYFLRKHQIWWFRKKLNLLQKLQISINKKKIFSAFSVSSVVKNDFLRIHQCLTEASFPYYKMSFRIHPTVNCEPWTSQPE